LRENLEEKEVVIAEKTTDVEALIADITAK
jgi:hypothetical protein